MSRMPQQKTLQDGWLHKGLATEQAARSAHGLPAHRKIAHKHKSKYCAKAVWRAALRSSP